MFESPFEDRDPATSELAKDETINFLHIGGLPAIFTFAEELAAYEG